MTTTKKSRLDRTLRRLRAGGELERALQPLQRPAVTRFSELDSDLRASIDRVWNEGRRLGLVGGTQRAGASPRIRRAAERR